MLAAGASLAVVGFGLHPFGEGVSVVRTTDLVTGGPLVWRASHALIGFGVLAAAVGGLLLLVSRSRLASHPASAVAWGLVVLFTVPFFLGNLLEASVVTDLAVAGRTDALQTWYGGFVLALAGSAWPVFLGYGVVAAVHARADSPLVPRWASWLAAVGWWLAIAFLVGVVFRVPALSLAQYAAAPGILWLVAVGVQVYRTTRPTARTDHLAADRTD